MLLATASRAPSGIGLGEAALHKQDTDEREGNVERNKKRIKLCRSAALLYPVGAVFLSVGRA